MAWVLLEGLDRSGKSTVAEIYKKKGFEVVHLGAPKKDYFLPGYTGPSYLEEIVDLYNIYGGKDVLFDRTVYGELVWPEVFNRQSLLSQEDFEYLSKLEYNNDAVKILMTDEDPEAHWQRCVDNNEPLNRVQFIQAGRLYDELARKHNFERHQLRDFGEFEELSDKDRPVGDTDSSGDIRQDGESTDAELPGVPDTSTLEEKLERANAIRSLLGASLVKKKGEVFGKLEQDIKSFLEKELQNIFTEPKTDDFSKEEVLLLKGIAQRLKEKTG